MTIRQLRALRDSLNLGGTEKLRRILQCSERTVRNKMPGVTMIAAGDVALIEAWTKKRKPIKKG
jgi:hypothetical protein